jgi:hypothetical protein
VGVRAEAGSRFPFEGRAQAGTLPRCEEVGVGRLRSQPREAREVGGDVDGWARMSAAEGKEARQRLPFCRMGRPSKECGRTSRLRGGKRANRLNRKEEKENE